MSFLFELSQWGFLLVLISFIISAFMMSRTDSKLLIFGPIILVGLLWVGSLHFITEEDSASLESFCLDKGFTDSKFIYQNESYCLDQENGYLIEQEVRLVSDEWLFVKRMSGSGEGGN